MRWEDAQEAELEWWGSCVNTFDEEAMQLLEAERMGLVVEPGPIVRTAGGIVDIGGGPVSLLLKAQGWTDACVVDPGRYPGWTADRYDDAGIALYRQPGESWLEQPNDGLGDLLEASFDEVWIYNTLQHVMDPEAIVAGACRLAPVVRLFEWIEFETNECHIHELRAEEIARWAAEAGASVAGEVESIEWAGNQNLSYHATFTRER